MTISLDAVTKIAKKSAVTKGIEFYNENRVELVEHGQYFAEAFVSDSDGFFYEVYVDFVNGDHTKVATYHCECESFAYIDSACEHIVATVLEVQREDLDADEFIALQQSAASLNTITHNADKSNKTASVPSRPRPAAASARKTDPAALQLLKKHAERAARVSHVSSSGAGDAVLEATLTFDYHGTPSLSFKVGSSRLYVIKDLRDFRSGFDNSDTMKFGKNYSLWLDRASFAEESLPLLDFFLHFYGETNLFATRVYYYHSNPRKTMELTSVLIDEFFKVMEGKPVPAQWEHMQDRFLVVREDLPLLMAVVKKDTGFVLTRDSDFKIIRGADHVYVIDRKQIHICSEAYTKACAELLGALVSAHGQLYFSERELPALLSSVLKDAAPHLDIRAQDGVMAYAPPPLVTKVFFDVDEGAYITARMTFTYGERTFPAFEDKKLSQSLDLGAEVAAEQTLFRYMGNVRREQGTLVLMREEPAVYELAARGVEEIASFAEVFASEAFKKITIRPNPNVNIGVQVDGRLLEIDFDIEDVDFKELAAILASYRQAKKYHRLKDGSFLSLEDDGLAQLSELADGLDIADKFLAKGHAEFDINRALYVDELLKKSDDLRYERNHAFKNIVRQMQSVADADFAIPKELEKVLRNYQKTGYRWLRTIDYLGFGGILADDMGLGKTLQVLALLQEKKAAYAEGTGSGHPASIVVCPASLVLNWESEVAKFTPQLKVAALIGGADERRKMIDRISDYDLVVTSYDQLRRDVELYENLEFECVILDEAQFIKNQTTKKARSVKKLKCKTRLALTGTPVENNLAELWSIFDFLMPGYLNTYSHFRNKYESPIVKNHDKGATERLRALVRPFILRRLKRDVLKELPEKTESVHRVAMEDAQRKVYIGALAQAKDELAEKLEEAGGVARGRIMVLAALTRMRQICCDPSLVYDNYKGESAKLNACMELVESSMESGHRMLLFSQFTSMMELIAAQLKKRGIDYYVLDGSTPKQERQSLVNKFNGGDTPIFLISLKAGGTGLNLTGADVVIHYDPWWNVSAQNQATDRAHRIGQVNKVQVYKLIVKDTIEDKIMEMQERKAALADSIIQEGGNAFDALTGEELLSLFER